MHVTQLSLSDFRNYARLELRLAPGLTVIVGQNGEGKTNLLEALMVCSRLRSPRTEQIKEAIRWGAESATAHAVAESSCGPRKVDIAVGARGLAVKVNGQPPHRRADAVGALLAVLFTPDDLRLVKDEPERRRSFLDGVLALVRPALAGLPADYFRVLRQRNTLLKRLREERGGAGELPAWDDQLVHHGTTLAIARAEVAQRLAESAVKHHSKLAPEDSLEVRYSSDVLEEGADEPTVAARFRRRLAERRDDEILRGATLVGPHRDDLVFTVDGHSARDFASQGQQRSTALALKLAELDLAAKARQETPVLLLDDVMSELDGGRRAALARVVTGLEQTIITTTTPEYFASATAVPVRWLKLSGRALTEGEP